MATTDKGWGDLIPMIPRIFNLGVEVYQTVTKEGLVPADKAILPAGATEEDGRSGWSSSRRSSTSARKCTTF